MEASELKMVKSLEEDGAKLKRMYADLALKLEMANTSSKKALKPCIKSDGRGTGRNNISTRYQQDVSSVQNQAK